MAVNTLQKTERQVKGFDVYINTDTWEPLLEVLGKFVPMSAIQDAKAFFGFDELINMIAVEYGADVADLLDEAFREDGED